MKPWEETWDAVLTIAVRIRHPNGDLRWTEGGESQLMRAKLAAQAPAMARLLLQFTGNDGRQEYSPPDQDAVVAILRDAGVIP